MTDNLKRPNLTSDEDKDYHEHCRNIARIISKTEALHEVDTRIRKYLLAVGAITP